MQKELRVTTTVLRGGRIEIVNEELHEGDDVEVVVLHTPAKSKRSAYDIIQGAPGQRLFKSAEEVDAYLKNERASWGR